MTHIIGKERVTVSAGEILFLNQYVSHEILPSGKEDIGINLIVLPEFFDTAFEMIGKDNMLADFIVSALREKNGVSQYLYFQVAGEIQIQNLMENMVWTIFYDIGNKRSCNQITMGLMLLQLLNHMDKMETGNAGFDNELTGTVLNYIEEHYKNGSLSELAQIMNYDVYWLSKAIKKQTGKTYKELLQSKRMSQAAYLLTNSTLPVADIIESVGYDNTSYFYRKFKEWYGMGPKEYRAGE